MALDITTSQAEMAVVTAGADPSETDWHPAEWVRSAPTQEFESSSRLTSEFWFVELEAEVDGEKDRAWLRLLVGPDVFPSGAARVSIFSRVHDSPETPVRNHGTVHLQ